VVFERFERLKPNSLDFSNISLSKYNTTLCLFDIANASEGRREDVLCYKFGDKWSKRTEFKSTNRTGLEETLMSLLLRIFT
jgi:hypothetical protein